MSPRLIAALGLAGLVLGLLIWALLERSGRLECAVTVAKREGELKEFRLAYGVLAQQAQNQSAAVADLEAKGAAARAAGRQAAIAAAAGAKAQQGTIDALEARLAAATPSGVGCHEALDEIRGQL